MALNGGERFSKLIGKRVRIASSKGRIYVGRAAEYSRVDDGLWVEDVEEQQTGERNQRLFIPSGEIAHVELAEGGARWREPRVILLFLALVIAALYALIAINPATPLMYLIPPCLAFGFGIVQSILSRSRAWLSGSLSIILWTLFIQLAGSPNPQNGVAIVVMLLAVAAMAVWASTARLPIKPRPYIR